MIENRHIPNLVIAKKICSKCVEVWKSNNKSVKCSSDCGIFNFNDNNSFCEWLFKQEEYIALAHNLFYDGFFVMKYIVENLLPVESTKGLNILVNGGKLLCIQFRGVKIIDSYNFIPLALAKCPKTSLRIKKGLFSLFI